MSFFPSAAVMAFPASSQPLPESSLGFLLTACVLCAQKTNESGGKEICLSYLTLYLHGVGGMSQWLMAHIALAEDLNLVLCTHIGVAHNYLTLASGNLTPVDSVHLPILTLPMHILK